MKKVEALLRLILNSKQVQEPNYLLWRMVIDLAEEALTELKEKVNEEDERENIQSITQYLEYLKNKYIKEG